MPMEIQKQSTATTQGRNTPNVNLIDFPETYPRSVDQRNSKSRRRESPDQGMNRGRITPHEKLYISKPTFSQVSQKTYLEPS
jgi:hypothetical protein